VILEGQGNDGQATQSDSWSGTGVVTADRQRARPYMAMLRRVQCDKMTSQV
jgi:hypothetical protein